ncbi:MAG TPA: M20/M25/M40 family metallo-hydrolase [Thermoanaerobaculia bacterium]|jgi:hypothetical protein|nr:M20/M25/M40 family metallo-hydrolase [Thermoanaerobaculia bacterium]
MADQVGTRGFVGPEEGRGAGLIVALALLALALLLAVVQSGPPAPKGTDAPAAEFSAGRAKEVERGLLGDNANGANDAPHPVGSPANAAVRDRIVAHLRSLGYAPELQGAFSCGPAGNCARVSNVLARLPGREPGKSVLLTAHYDSVPAGPGAGDDGAGVAAVLEIARILKAGPPPRHGVLLLIDDGEEMGLLGARAFVERSPAAAEVGAIVNLEARGSGGPSLMFETSGPDAWLVSRWAAGASRPFTSSLFSTVYRYMPNDTDLTVFKRRNVPGMNFAFIDEPTHYHTPLDNLENLSSGSLQHHGDNALAAVRGLAESDLDHPPQGQAVFFDLFHATVVRWPAGFSSLLGLLALVLTVAAAVMARRRGLAGWGTVGLGLLVPLAALVFTLVLSLGLRALIAGAFPSPWVARPLPAMAAFWLLALAASIGAASLLARRSSAAGIWAGVWIFWSVVGLLLGLSLPGASYLFLVPALVAGLCGLALSGSPGGRTAAAILPVFVAGLLWFPVLRSLYLGLGLLGLLATAILLSFIFSALAPLVPGSRARWVLIAAGALAVICAVLAMVSPPFSPESPRPVMVQFHQDGDSGAARWVVRSAPPFPPALRKAAEFASKPGPAYPWSPPMGRAFLAPAPPLNVPAPALAVLEDSAVGGKRRLRLRLTSSRGAPIGTIVVPAGAKLESIKIDGRAIPLEGRRPGPRGPAAARGWQLFTNYTVPPQGSEIEVVLGATQPLDWYVYDRTPGLPPTAQALLAARPKDAVPIQEGDLTMVSRKVRI